MRRNETRGVGRSLKKVLDFLRKPRLWAILLTVVVFACFFTYLVKQHSYVYMYHDDYGYATLSYVYWEPGIVGHDFTTEQLIHYLGQHYEKWGGRVLSFAQEILLFKSGTDAMRAAQSIVICLTFLLIFNLSRKNSKGKPYLIALFACLLYGFISEATARSGIYWYSASIAYLFPVLYMIAGSWVFFKIMYDDSGKIFTLPKLLMWPGAIVLFFFAGFSMEQIGLGAVTCAALITVGAFWKYKKPWLALYSAPVLAAAMWGYNYMLIAPGNLARRNSSLYADYYKLSFKDQIITSGKSIVDTIFSPANLLFAALLFICAGVIAYILLKKCKNPIAKALNGITMGFSAVLLACALLPALNTVCFPDAALRSGILWIYMVFVTFSVSQWLLVQKMPYDTLIWFIFMGGLVTQAAALVSPVFFDRLALVFEIVWFLVATRLFAYVIGAFTEHQTESKHPAAAKVAWILVPVMIISVMNLTPLYRGYQQNAAVNEYNNQMMELAAEKYEMGIELLDLQLMKLPNSRYTETQPYDRELIMDWMKIYFKLPKTVNFVYNEYDAKEFAKLEKKLQKEQDTMAIRHEGIE